MNDQPDMPKTQETDRSLPAAAPPKAGQENAGPADKDRAPPMTAKEEWVDFLKTAAIAVLCALLIRTFALEPFNIPSGSMKPTLEIGDYLFVSKPAYGYSRYSFPFGLAPVEGRIMTGDRAPLRGDVIVFKLPTNTSIDYIKRVIGLPGDRVQMRGGLLYLNGQEVPRQPLGRRRITENGVTINVFEYTETLPNGVQHSIYEESSSEPLDNTEEFTVPDGHYFVMGDNRDNSQDSRVMDHVGFVPAENVVGRANFIFFSTNGYANFAEIWKWPKSIRYGRLFRGIGGGKAEPEAQQLGTPASPAPGAPGDE